MSSALNVRVKVFAAQREMRFDCKTIRRFFGIIMNEDQVCGKDLGVVFELSNNRGRMSTDRCREGQVTGAKMNLHDAFGIGDADSFG